MILHHRSGLLLLVLLFLGAAMGANSQREHDVLTKHGIVRGIFSRTARGRYLASFRGIPYAEPPIGHLRFRSPQPWSYNWHGWYDARKDRPMCVQLDNKGHVIGNENCLYVNVYAPYDTALLRKTKKFPVIVFVHGGAFNSGSGNSTLYAPDYLLDQDIVLVTLNYRLNIFGFFSTASEASPGNYGLKDIITALRWVQDNIAAFGGDPSQVTLMGQSAGAAAVHLLTLTNKTEGLFNKYIIHSGSSLGAWAVHPRKNIRNSSLRMAKILGCLPERIDNVELVTREPRELSDESRHESNEDEYTKVDEEEMMKCMRSVDGKTIERLSVYYQVWRLNPWCIFGPTVEEESEDAVLTMDPMTIITNGQFRDIPRIVGVTRDEGLVKAMGFIAEPDAREEFINNYQTYLPYVVEYHEAVANTSAFADEIEKFYFNGNVSENLMSNITELLGDAIIVWPTYRAVKYQSSLMQSKTYLFWFCYEGTFSTTFYVGRPQRYGVSHTDDLNYLFPMLNNLYGEKFQLHNTENDTMIINIMTEMWSNFAKHGVPKAWRVPAWPVFDATERYLKVGDGRAPDVTVGSDLYPERMAFWESLTESLTSDTVDTELPIQEVPSELESDRADRSATSPIVCLLTIAAFCVK